MGVAAVWVLLYDLIMLEIEKYISHSEDVVVLAAELTSLCVYRRFIQEVQLCSFRVNGQWVTEKYSLRVWEQGTNKDTKFQ